MIKKLRFAIGDFWKKLSKVERIFLVAVIVLTMFRFFLAVKIPLHIQAAAIYDDRMLVDYSANLLSGNWLGDFGRFSLAKGASYSIFLAVNYFFGLPYSFTLVLLYTIAIIVFCVALSRLIKNKTFLYILYTVLLYSPVMFHDENVQKIYRGGVIVIFALFIVAAVIGIYTRIEEENRKILKWAVLAVLSLIFFWFLKEDSVWILPFVCGGIGLTIIRILKMKLINVQKVKKVLLAVMPLVALSAAIFGYKMVNYVFYDEFAVTDRQGTYFKEVATDLIHIEGDGRSKDNWVTRDMLEKAYNVSPTLMQVMGEINASYEGWAKEDGEIEGDIIFWAIKDAVAEAGFYESGKKVNEFYKKVHEELSMAFEDGRLEKNNDFYISSITKGINADEIPEFLEFVNASKDNVLSYMYNETGLYPATGDSTGIALFDELTMSQYISPDADMVIYRPASIAVNVANSLVQVYKATGRILFYVASTVFIIFTGYIVVVLLKRKHVDNLLSIYLVLFGLLSTCFTLFFGTVFFCRFLSQRKVYDYASPMIPILVAAELILIYMLIKGGKKVAVRCLDRIRSKKL